MKKKVLLLMCIALSLCSFSSAGAASPTITKMKMNKSEHNLSMYVDYDGQLSITQFDYSPNQISDINKHAWHRYYIVARKLI